MRKILLLIALALLLGCSGDKVSGESTGVRLEGTTREVKIVVIDECEYLIFGSGYQAGLAHKGNCQYCAERKSQWKK